MNITQFSEKELVELNHKIINRLKFLQQARTHRVMLNFNVGDPVSFNADGRQIRGVVSKFNRKTVTIVTTEGTRWNISPGLLSKHVEKDVTPKSDIASAPILTIKKNPVHSGVSRNAPCPCGSGKKYKRCCLQKDSFYRKHFV